MAALRKQSQLQRMAALRNLNRFYEGTGSFKLSQQSPRFFLERKFL